MGYSMMTTIKKVLIIILFLTTPVVIAETPYELTNNMGYIHVEGYDWKDDVGSAQFSQESSEETEHIISSPSGNEETQSVAPSSSIEPTSPNISSGDVIDAQPSYSTQDDRDEYEEEHVSSTSSNKEQSVIRHPQSRSPRMNEERIFVSPRNNLPKLIDQNDKNQSENGCSHSGQDKRGRTNYRDDSKQIHTDVPCSDHQNYKHNKEHHSSRKFSYRDYKRQLDNVCLHLDRGSRAWVDCRTYYKNMYEGICHQNGPLMEEDLKSAYCSLGDEMAVLE